jgi:hypothetical protein
MLKALDAENVKTLTSLCNLVYKTGKIPGDMKDSIFLKIPKKQNAMNALNTEL